MAMRPRGRTGSQPPRQPMRPTYETFRPESEWKDENEATLLLIHLPGFVREQIKKLFKYGDDTTLSLVVHGQRPIGGGRWINFNEVYKVPETCDPSKITDKFDHGVLTISMPKIVVTKQTDTTVAEDQAKTKREGPSSQEPAAQLSQDKISSAAPEVAATEKPREGEDVISQKATGEEKSQKDTQDKIPARKAAAPQKPTGEERTQEGNRDKKGDEKKDVMHQKPLVQDKEAEAVAPTIEEKDKGKKPEPDVEEKSKEDSIAGKSKDMKDESGAAKEVEGGGPIQAEERRLLINMGTALLTLVGVVAYISYTICRKV